MKFCATCGQVSNNNLAWASVAVATLVPLAVVLTVMPAVELFLSSASALIVPMNIGLLSLQLVSCTLLGLLVLLVFLLLM